MENKGVRRTILTATTAGKKETEHNKKVSGWFIGQQYSRDTRLM
jgi:hypothetical protein